MALADVFDALINRRVYKEPLSFSEAKDIIAAESGRQFDPDVVEAFLAIFDIFEAIARGCGGIPTRPRAPIPVATPDPRRPAPGPDGPSSAAISSIVLAYAAVASLWITLSDRALAWLSNDPARTALVSTLKGSLFVAVTSVLLYGLMRRLVWGLRTPHPGPPRPRRVRRCHSACWLAPS